MDATPVVPVPVTAAPATKLKKSDDLLLVQLAREIAMDIQPIEKILEDYKVTPEIWELIQKNPRFEALLKTAIEEWNSSLNTAERVKIKSLSFVEEALPELFARVHDSREPLPAKVKALEVIGKFGNLGPKDSQFGAGGGEKFSVTINLGDDKKLTISTPAPRITDDSTDQ